MSRDVPTLWDTQPAEPTWSVAELSEAIDLAMRRGFPDELWLRGEIRNLNRGRRMVWFDLVEPNGSTDLARPAGATLSVVLFDQPRRRVNARLRVSGGAVRMEDGTEVRIRGRVGWWAPGGRLQFAMTDIDPEFTLGRLAADRDQLLRKLDAQGLLGAQSRLTLPDVPLRVGLVTSADSAAEHDILHELEQSGIGFRVLRYDVRVQGRDAPREITRGLRAVASAGVDLLLLARGGGAATDLAAFDSEQIARTIAGLTVPVVTGIGHEIDRSVADEVAHTSCKTPTACAQMLVRRVRAFTDRLDEVAHHIARGARHRLDAADHRLAARADRVARAAGGSLVRAGHQIDRAAGRVEAGARVHLASDARRLDALRLRLRRRAPVVVEADRRRLDGLESRLRALDPARALARGWSITHTASGTVVRGPHDVTPGETLRTTVAGGTVHSTVTAVTTTDEPTSRED